MDEMILRERTRGDCYRFLSACFCQPGKNVFQEEKLLRNLTKSLHRICPEAALFSASMEDSILKYGNEELLVEYSRLFIGPFGVIAPPYGSGSLHGGPRGKGSVLLGSEEAQRIVQVGEVPLPRYSSFFCPDLGRIIAEEIRAPWDVP